MSVSFDTVIDEAVDYIMNLRKLKDAKNAIWEVYYKLGVKCSSTCGKDLNILLLNTPCWGFGDIIFCMKLATYLRSWYGARVTIASTHVDGFIKLGESSDNLVKLTGASKFVECRKFARLKLPGSLDKQDLIFVAPVQASLEADIPDVRKLVKYANKYNTYFFSEYNDSSWKNLDFPTGIGGKNLGIMISKVVVSPARMSSLPNPYAVAYIADWESIPGAERCFIAFVEMLAVKYGSMHEVFDVVVPPWIVRSIKLFRKRIVSKVSKYYPNIRSVSQDKPVVILSENSSSGKVLTLRGDVLPVSNEVMLQLMRGSVQDILLTGDQSISDVLSCCPNKNIFYQIAEWKSSFAKQLAKELPNKYLLSKKTSCGSLKAISYTSSYGNFLKKWDFAIRGKPKLDAVILAAVARKGSEDIRVFEEIVESSKRLNTLKEKLSEY